MKSKYKGIQYKSGPGRQKRWLARIMINSKEHEYEQFFLDKLKGV